MSSEPTPRTIDIENLRKPKEFAMSKLRNVLSTCLIGASALLAGVATAGAAPPSAAQELASDLQAIEDLRVRQHDAWKNGDGAAYAEIHTHDADVVTFSGDLLHGHDEIASGMQYFFDTYVGGTELKQVSETIAFPRPDMAIIIRTGCVLWNGETECTDEALSRNTSVALKSDGQWLIRSFQNTRLDPLL